MTPAPDLPMRERIAEAIYVRENQPCPPDECRASWRSKPADDYERGRVLMTADAVLAVLADLPDTAVEAGAKALYDSAALGHGPWSGLPEYVRATWRDRARIVLAATIAAIKGGKA